MRKEWDETGSLEEIEARLRRGEPFEEILKGSGWRDFEELTSVIVSKSGFLTIRNFRFSSRKRRYEVDIVAMENPRIILIDCKNWRLRIGKASALRESALKHFNRSLEFLYKLQEFRSLRLKEWNSVILIPVLVTLYEEKIREYEKVLVVPLFKIVSFLEEARSGLFDQICGKILRLDKWRAN
ncbi:MAG: NERD domain-containing protein [Candidatus Methanomethylicaceae archaeon]